MAGKTREQEGRSRVRIGCRKCGYFPRIAASRTSKLLKTCGGGSLGGNRASVTPKNAIKALKDPSNCGFNVFHFILLALLVAVDRVSYDRQGEYLEPLVGGATGDSPQMADLHS